MHDRVTAWATGDRTGLAIPADAAALQEGGSDWLTQAFRTVGALGDDNRVSAITRLAPFVAGGTGAKAVLSVRYERPGPPQDLFVKFSRNFNDPIMDNPRFHMEPEVRFAALSRAPGFPVDVPECLFADFERSSGTGLMITRRVPFGQGRIEPQYPKCLDELMPEPLEHYRALMSAVARLAGTHKADRLPAGLAEEFPWNPAAAIAADRLPPPDKLRYKLQRYADFAAAHPRLFPEAIREPAFLARLAEGAEIALAHEQAIRTRLHARSDFIALCHWNANADNAWFWREDDGRLHCGLIDWGSVGQMHLAMTVWGSLSGARLCFLEAHFYELLAHFAAEFAAAGAPPLDLAALREHLALYVGLMGLAYLLDAPPRIAREVPELADCTDPLDPRVTVNETPRVQLLMLTNWLSLWRREDVTGLLRRRFGESASRDASRFDPEPE